MKQLLTILLCFTSICGSAQTLADFENFNLVSGQALNGSDGQAGFSIGNAYLPNSYNPQWMSWSGWAISSMTDTTTPGFMNDLSAITGEGYNGSTTYATTFVVGESVLKLEGEAVGGIVNGFYITNNTYSYLSMLNGDGFAKRFGGITGNDPDYFLLTIKKYKDGILGAERVDFYLADYRFEDNAQDYIVSEWEYVDLISLGDVDSLSFTLSSTDIGTHGMNTPAYFSMDNFETADYSVNIENLVNNPLQIFPNPASNFVQIEGWNSPPMAMQIELIDLTGKRFFLQNQASNTHSFQLNLKELPKGIYFVRMGNQTAKLLKQ